MFDGMVLQKENRQQLHLTSDKRLRCYAPSPKMPLATSFIRKTLYAIALKRGEENENI
ncbi:MAG: hypothetical protein ACP5JH_12155 [Bacteroidota bacterium]